MPLNTIKARKHLAAFSFKPLFIEELGWNHHDARLEVPADGQFLGLSAIAEKHGMIAFLCNAGPDGRILDYQMRRKIERQVAKTAHEHIIIFVDANKSAQIWQWVRREQGKPAACREHSYHVGQPGDSLVQKLSALVISLEEEESLTLLDVTGRARKAFDVERVTKRFYDRFKEEHATFLKFLEGIPDREMERWYVSVMLNRLMFIYFIQKRGFLGGDLNYLQNRLSKCRNEQGKDHYYQDFLCPLFFEGFAKKAEDRSTKAKRLLGDVPYLDGGIFMPHQIEQLHGKTIRISDKAFERLFEFFDAYQWHLDERPLRKDDEINPDVLGYIFEKYINQKEMGAYYTREDITEYIAKNTIIPYLFDAARDRCALASEGEQSVWQLLRENPDRYIYPGIAHGVTLPLPLDIEAGLANISRREAWNRPAPAEYALPTEAWREVVSRRNYYKAVTDRIAEFEIRSINDVITNNLDIRQFAQDVLEGCEGPELLEAFWRVIESITVLDPTCGSGAFLFAALNILDPLYEACLERMEFFLEEWGESAKNNYPDYYELFTATLRRIETHPNRRYFILKSIIVNNLYGVDIMEEAVEICKLRLFLKIVAQIDSVEDVEPLPDIDFNIRAGNTLVGFASLDELKRTQQGTLGFGRNEVSRIEKEAQIVDKAFRKFHEMQTDQGNKVVGLMSAKENLSIELKRLTDELDRFLAAEYGRSASKDVFKIWRKNHSPFHWFAEFYGIVEKGGFDVIIGNPPYAEIPKEVSRTLLQRVFASTLPKWSRDENLYTLVVERSLQLAKKTNGHFGMILPLSLSFSTKKPFVQLRNVLLQEHGAWYWSHFDRIPSALFGNEVRTRCTIALLCRTHNVRESMDATTSLMRWNTNCRDFLFHILRYSRITPDISVGIPKVASQVQADVLERLRGLKAPLANDLTQSISFSDLAAVAPKFPTPCVFVGGTAYNWLPAWRDIPETKTLAGLPSVPARTIGYRFPDEDSASIVFALLCSSIGYWWWAVASDGFNLKRWLIERFPLSVSSIPHQHRRKLILLSNALRKELIKNYVFKENKGRIGNFYLPACGKQISAIDDFLAHNIPALSQEFFTDIQDFNMRFSHIAPETEESDDIECSNHYKIDYRSDRASEAAEDAE